jgi:hypothetical protein
MRYRVLALEDGTNKVIPKRQEGITTIRYVTPQKSADLIYFSAEA